MLLLLLALLASCSGGGQRPDAAPLLARSAQAMRQVDTVRFDISVEGGGVGEFAIRAAQGQLTRRGDAKGTVRLDQFGQLVELRFVLVDGNAYVQGPTGGFQAAPYATQVYDPSTILDPHHGVAALLARATQATTETRTEVDGVDAYRVRATFPGAVLDGLVPGLTTDTRGTVWVGAGRNRLLQARFPLPGGGSATVRLFDFGAPARITAPQ